MPPSLLATGGARLDFRGARVPAANTVGPTGMAAMRGNSGRAPRFSSRPFALVLPLTAGNQDQHAPVQRVPWRGIRNNPGGRNPTCPIARVRAGPKQNADRTASPTGLPHASRGVPGCRRFAPPARSGCPESLAGRPRSGQPPLPGPRQPRGSRLTGPVHTHEYATC